MESIGRLQKQGQRGCYILYIIHYKSKNISRMKSFRTSIMFYEQFYQYAHKGFFYIRNPRGTKITFSPFFSQQCNSMSHQHLELLFISFGSVSEMIVQKPSGFHCSSSIFEFGAMTTTHIPHPCMNLVLNQSSVEHIPRAHIAQFIELLLCAWL